MQTINCNPNISFSQFQPKSQIALTVGVSYSTFFRWLKIAQSERPDLFPSPQSKLLSPAAIAYMAHRFCFDCDLITPSYTKP